MTDQFERTRLLLGRDAMDRLRRAHVIVFGVGGVGGYAVEALARSGVGALTLVDNDRVSVTNLNRQILALHSTVGKYKADAAAERVADIAPDCRVTPLRLFYLPETDDRFDFREYDYIVDAIDTVSGKLLLAQRAQEAGTPIISSMGAGNKLDPTAFEVADIYETAVCPLARIMRKELRKRGVAHLKVVYSREEPMRPLESPSEPPDPERGRRDTPGSVAFVPSVAGLILAGEVIRDLIGAPRK
ncbi:MAG: tRNA threonylcarbamoyladenosine dehydratase [Oscillospiraceae bacterium]|nr:tRNA threonylcarbamoyladenosine dehydratase [Oscillospiraceae bacterium]